MRVVSKIAYQQKTKTYLMTFYNQIKISNIKPKTVDLKHGCSGVSSILYSFHRVASDNLCEEYCQYLDWAAESARVDYHKHSTI